MRQKILIIFGTRPEAIKLLPVIEELKKFPEIFDLKLIATSQHTKLLKQVLTFFREEIHYDLNILRHKQSLASLSHRLIKKLSAVLAAEHPDLIIVQGDTMSAFCGALVAFYHKIKIAHIEAGLRTFTKYEPFPEEMNRTLIGKLADYHFAPTDISKNNLIAEGIPKRNIFVTGNTILDSINLFSELKTDLPVSIRKILDKNNGKRLILSTLHRRENFGLPFKKICDSMQTLTQKRDDIFCLFQVHPNPNISLNAQKYLGSKKRLYLIPPQPYPVFLKLIKKSYLILTDSGGIQEEAPFFGIPVIVCRNATERIEGIQALSSVLTGSFPEIIIEKLLDDHAAYKEMAQKRYPFGKGKPSEKIVQIIKKLLQNRKN